MKWLINRIIEIVGVGMLVATIVFKFIGEFTNFEFLLIGGIATIIIQIEGANEQEKEST